MSTLTSESLGGISDKPSTKLHAPPGGRSNFSLSHYEPPAPTENTRTNDANSSPNDLKKAIFKDEVPKSPPKQKMTSFVQSFSITDGDDSSRFPKSPPKTASENSTEAPQPSPSSYVKKGYHNQHWDIFGTRNSLDAASPPPCANPSASMNTESSSELRGDQSHQSPSLSSTHQKVLTSPDFGFGKDQPPPAQIAYENAVFPDELNEVPTPSTPETHPRKSSLPPPSLTLGRASSQVVAHGQPKRGIDPRGEIVP